MRQSSAVMNTFTVMLLPLIVVNLLVPLILAIQLDKDGGYTDIVVRISSTVPEDSCPKILANIKVIINDYMTQK